MTRGGCTGRRCTLRGEAGSSIRTLPRTTVLYCIFARTPPSAHMAAHMLRAAATADMEREGDGKGGGGGGERVSLHPRIVTILPRPLIAPVSLPASPHLPIQECMLDAARTKSTGATGLRGHARGLCAAGNSELELACEKVAALCRGATPSGFVPTGDTGSLDVRRFISCCAAYRDAPLTGVDAGK